MPFAYSIHPEFNLLIKRYFGKVTFAEFGCLSDKAVSDDRFRPDLCIIDDMRDVSEIDLDYQKMQMLCSALASFQAKNSSELRCAFFAPGDLAFGMARMFQTLTSDTEGVEIGVFRDLDDVLAFHNLSGPAADLVAVGSETSETMRGRRPQGLAACSSA